MSPSLPPLCDELCCCSLLNSSSSFTLASSNARAPSSPPCHRSRNAPIFVIHMLFSGVVNEHSANTSFFSTLNPSPFHFLIVISNPFAVYPNKQTINQNKKQNFKHKEINTVTNPRHVGNFLNSHNCAERNHVRNNPSRNFFLCWQCSHQPIAKQEIVETVNRSTLLKRNITNDENTKTQQTK
jgi:hypothetical protein